jgi:hypothetical protein
VNSRDFLAALVILAAFATFNCSRPRPELADAKADFAKRYPTAEIVDVRMSEDEVVARSFDITYRRRGEQETKTLNLQYMKNDNGIYELQPSPPSEAP